MSIMLEAAQLDKMDLHSFLDGITLPDHSLLANCNGSPGLFLEDSPNTSVDSLCGSGSSAFPFEDQLPFGPAGEGELLPALPFMEFSQVSLHHCNKQV